LIWLVMLGCRPEDLTVQALVDARAEQLALDAALPTRLALACGGLAAQAAPISQEAWAGLDRFQPQAELALLLDLEPTQVQTHSGTGAIKASWTGVEFSPDLFGRVELDVLRAQNHFQLAFAQDPGEPPGVKGSCSASIESDAEGDPVVSLDLELDVGTHTNLVAMPSRPDADDTGQAQASPPRWASGGGVLPIEGDFQWQRVLDGNQQFVRGLDVAESEASMEAWPAVAMAQDWEHKLSVDLRRTTD
jgi:hypothetical protein